MPIIENAIDPVPGLKRVFIEVDRFQLQKCRFRCKAKDGMDFAFALGSPLKNGNCVYKTATHCYELRQLREKVVRIELPGSSSKIARLAWQIGNLHQPVDVRETFLLVADDPALRRILKKGGFKFKVITDTFTPAAHSAFAAHQHVPGLEYQHSHIFGISHGAGA